jgi:hypothetical protein
MCLLAVLSLIAMSKLFNATIATISVGALALGGNRASILFAALISLVQKLTTDS